MTQIFKDISDYKTRSKLKLISSGMHPDTAELLTNKVMFKMKDPTDDLNELSQAERSLPLMDVPFCIVANFDERAIAEVDLFNIEAMITRTEYFDAYSTIVDVAERFRSGLSHGWFEGLKKTRDLYVTESPNGILCCSEWMVERDHTGDPDSRYIKVPAFELLWGT